MHYQYLNTRIYKTIVTDDKEKACHHPYQVNNPLMVIGVAISRAHDTTYTRLKSEFEEYYKDSQYPLKVMPCYPFKKEEMANTTMDYTYAHGYMVEWKKHDPNEPYVVPGDATPEQKDALLKERLMPYPVISPFVLLFPETPYYMFDITLSYVPETAITYLDKDHDINTVAGEIAKEKELHESVTPNILLDPTIHLTPEDREKFMQKVVEMEEKRMAEETAQGQTVSAPEDIDTPEA